MKKLLGLALAVILCAAPVLTLADANTKESAAPAENTTVSDSVALKVDVYPSLKENTGVGKDWEFSYEINEIKHAEGMVIHATEGETVKVSSEITEQDKKQSDTGKEESSYIISAEDLSKGFYFIQTVNVQENYGDHYGEATATWYVIYIFTPVTAEEY